MSAVEVANDHELRSQLMRHLVSQVVPVRYPRDGNTVPRVLVQYWNDPDAVPEDVQECIDSWSAVESLGIERVMFNDALATEFIRDRFTEGHVQAFERCTHPAMRADYFRLCFILSSGGFYVDVDDVFQGSNIDHLFYNGHLKVQPLCYDTPTDSMVDPVQSASRDDHEGRIFYVNNNPLVAPPDHPVVERALERATTSLLTTANDDRDIQSLTGPGNLTACLVEHVLEQERLGHAPDFELLSNWETIATSKWPLSYRADHRNWRNWTRGDEHTASVSPEEAPG
jgi:mannosyltransferase OCH1-like enzyme